MFRVYLFSGSGPGRSWRTGTFDVADADVDEVMRWAQDRAGASDLFAVALVGRDKGRLGLTWLTGIDVNDADAESRSGFQGPQRYGEACRICRPNCGGYISLRHHGPAAPRISTRSGVPAALTSSFARNPSM